MCAAGETLNANTKAKHISPGTAVRQLLLCLIAVFSRQFFLISGFRFPVSFYFSSEFNMYTNILCMNHKNKICETQKSVDAKFAHFVHNNWCSCRSLTSPLILIVFIDFKIYSFIF